ncbi:hypothetical protein Trydic_g20069 [Trypoxylus dichotomus]
MISKVREIVLADQRMKIREIDTMIVPHVPPRTPLAALKALSDGEDLKEFLNKLNNPTLRTAITQKTCRATEYRRVTESPGNCKGRKATKTSRTQEDTQISPASSRTGGIGGRQTKKEVQPTNASGPGQRATYRPECYQPDDNLQHGPPFDEYRLLVDDQFGFRPDHSTMPDNGPRQNVLPQETDNGKGVYGPEKGVRQDPLRRSALQVEGSRYFCQNPEDDPTPRIGNSTPSCTMRDFQWGH